MTRTRAKESPAARLLAFACVRRHTVLMLSRALALLVVAASTAECVPAIEPVPVEAPAPEYPSGLLANAEIGTVEVVFRIGKDGNVHVVASRKSGNDGFVESCREAIERWRFDSPQGGSGDGQIWVVKVEFREGGVTVGKVRDGRGLWTWPKLTKSVAPGYPTGLAVRRNTGRVRIRFIVSNTGVVQDPKVLQSTHPAFEVPAVAALLQWKFSPAMFDGTSVAARMELPITFAISDSSGAEGFVVGKNRRMPDPPDEFRVDIPPKPKMTVFAVHPFESVVEGKKGSAEVKVLVGPTGTVLATLIVEASSPEFGLSLAAAMEAWTFEPAIHDEKPAIAMLSRKHEFEFHGRDSAVGENAALTRQIRLGRFKPAKARELDSPLAPAFTVPAVHPTALIGEGKFGNAKVEVIVDRKGRAVLPRIVEASEPEFGWAAATAAQRWLFTPPTVKGKPVEVKVVIPFRFVPPEANTEEAEN